MASAVTPSSPVHSSSFPLAKFTASRTSHPTLLFGSRSMDQKEEKVMPKQSTAANPAIALGLQSTHRAGGSLSLSCSAKQQSTFRCCSVETISPKSTSAKFVPWLRVPDVSGATKARNIPAQGDRSPRLGAGVGNPGNNITIVPCGAQRQKKIPHNSARSFLHSNSDV